MNDPDQRPQQWTTIDAVPLRRGMLVRNITEHAFYRGVCRVITVERETAEVLPVNGEAFRIHLKAVQLEEAQWKDIGSPELIEQFAKRSNSILCSRCISEAKALRTEDGERAVWLFTEALTYKPGSIETLHRRADLFYALRRYGEAEADFTALLALPIDGMQIWSEKESKTTLLTKRSKSRREQGKLEEAATDLCEALSLGPEKVDTHQSLAGIYLELSEAHVRRARELTAEWEAQTLPQGDKDQLGLF